MVGSLSPAQQQATQTQQQLCKEGSSQAYKSRLSRFKVRGSFCSEAALQWSLFGLPTLCDCSRGYPSHHGRMCITVVLLVCRVTRFMRY